MAEQEEKSALLRFIKGFFVLFGVVLLIHWHDMNPSILKDIEFVIAAIMIVAGVNL